MKVRVKETLGKFLAIVLALCVSFTSIVYLEGQASVAPDNPLTGLQGSERMSVAEAAQVTVDENILDQEASITDASSELLSDESSLSQVYAGYEGDSADGSNKGNSPGGEDPYLSLDGRYFRTSIEHGETIDSNEKPKEYSFTIEHLISTLEPVGITFSLNDQALTGFDGDVYGGTVSLQEGKNTLAFDITYRLPSGSTKIVQSQEYVLYYVNIDKDILAFMVPDPGSHDFEWNSSTLMFTVKTYPEVVDELQVKCNGALLYGEGADGRDFTAHLTLGKENIITFRVASEGRTTFYDTYTVTYVLSDKLELFTDLTADTVYDPLVTFRVKIENAEGEPQLTVRHNGSRIQPVSVVDTVYTYTVTLKLGSNTITMVAQDYVQQSKEILVTKRYTRDPGIPPDDVPSPDPVHNVTNGMKTSSAVFTYTVSALEPVYGGYLSASNFEVRLNGVLCHLSEVRDPVYYYLLFLEEGENTLQITIRTYDEYYYRYTYKMYYEPSGTAEAIGSVYVSAEAYSIGLGTIASGEVPIYSGEPCSYAVVRMLERAGYTCTVTGEFNYGLYLRYINKQGITNGWNISNELKAQIVEAYPNSWHGEYYTDSLGENNFTSCGSGWLVTVNGKSISGLSNYYPKSGDVIKVQFTLANGRDIGLGEANFTY